MPIERPEALQLDAFAMIIGEGDVDGAGEAVFRVEVPDSGGRLG